MNDIDKFFIGVVIGLAMGAGSMLVYKNEEMKWFKDSAIKAKAGCYKTDPKTGVTRFVWYSIQATPQDNER